MRISVDPQAMAAAFDTVKDDPVFAESAEVVRHGGRPIEMFQALSLAPGVLEAFTAVSRGVYPGGLVEREVKEIIILEASRRNACQFCTQSHIAMARMLGMSDQPLELLENPAGLTERQQLALELTREVMTDANRIPEALITRLRNTYTDPEIVEITFMIGFINCLNLFNNTLGVTYHGEYQQERLEA